MNRDILIVIALDVALIALVSIYVGLTEEWASGASSLHIATWCGILALTLTSVAGVLMQRVSVGVIGIGVLWIGFIFVDKATSSAPFGPIVMHALICAAIHLTVFVIAVWLTRNIRGGI